MPWVLEYDAPKGLRTNRGFGSVLLEEIGFWYYRDTGVWAEDRPEGDTGWCSTHHHCYEGAPKTTKAFLRYLRKRPYLKGQTVYLNHRCYMEIRGKYIGLGITAKWVE